YLVGDLGLAAQATRGASKGAKKAAAVDAENAAAATALDEPQPTQRRRRAKATLIGRGYEFMDLEPEPTVTASDGGSGPLGFAGSGPREGGAEPSGLSTLTRDQFGGASTVPMLPTTWNPDLD
ncbi:MAG TPA: hypothetical protein VFU72_12625, partial [Nitrolancea sp.]|nr:hypothetical protein [Nitrolancea sp.]